MKMNDQGLGAAGLIALATALAVLLSIGLPTIIATDQIKLSDWVGFGGNLLGAGVTLAAAYLAWRGIRDQIVEQRKLVESQRRDAANVRLTDFLNAIQDCYTAHLLVPKPTSRSGSEFVDFQTKASDPRLRAAIVDPLMGRDGGLVGLLIHSLTRIVEANAGNIHADPLGRSDLVVSYLFPDLIDSFAARREVMIHGSVDELTGLAILDRESYFRTLQTGAAPRLSFVDEFMRKIRKTS